jgi:hypothetical protein
MQIPLSYILHFRSQAHTLVQATQLDTPHLHIPASNHKFMPHTFVHNLHKYSAFDIYLTYKDETVGLCVCLFAYSSRTEIPICTKFGMLISSEQEENTGG